ncbi:hypothetical protein SDC9_65448 [bioreactor metagenome]|uniref:Uncharacterized protein n=1 Tax=bioreactor metagenome TaxID=1076179 RepID=A0A644XS11_9ZZZZ
MQGGQHSLVNHLLGREADDVKTAVGRCTGLQNSFLNFFAQDIKFTFQFILRITSGNKNLLDIWLVGAGNLPQTGRIYRHVPYGKQMQILFHGEFLNKINAFTCFLLIFRKENQACPIFAFRGNLNSLKQNKLVGDMNENTCSVSGFVVCTFRPPVHHIFEHLKSVFYRFVRFVSVQRDYQPNATGIVLILKRIKGFTLVISYIL